MISYQWTLHIRRCWHFYWYVPFYHSNKIRYTFYTTENHNAHVLITRRHSIKIYTTIRCQYQRREGIGGRYTYSLGYLLPKYTYKIPTFFGYLPPRYLPTSGRDLGTEIPYSAGRDLGLEIPTLTWDQRYLHPLHGQTHACEKHYLPITIFAGGNKGILHGRLFLDSSSG